MTIFAGKLKYNRDVYDYQTDEHGGHCYGGADCGLEPVLNIRDSFRKTKSFIP